MNYIEKVYIPMWFKIKNKTSITEGGKGFHELKARSRYLEAEPVRREVQGVHRARARA